jgi:hypothetical protein
MTDITEYLRSQNYADHVVSGGLQRLVLNWEHVSECLAKAESIHTYFYEFLNDIDGRRILRQCMELPGVTGEYAARIADADRRFIAATRPTSLCVWGEENAKNYGYTPEVDWFYFRCPRVNDGSWEAEFYPPTKLPSGNVS